MQKIHLTYYSLMVQDLWQIDYQILSIIFLKEFIELNVNLDKMIKNVKHLELIKVIKVLAKVINESLMKSYKYIQIL